MDTMVITGASTGVGKAAAMRFASEGYAVCALARSVDKPDRLVAEGNGNIFSYPADVSDSAMEETSKIGYQSDLSATSGLL